MLHNIFFCIFAAELRTINYKMSIKNRLIR